jgi:hypothetical protein
MPISIDGHSDRGRMISKAIVTPFRGHKIVHPLLKPNLFNAASARK